MPGNDDNDNKNCHLCSGKARQPNWPLEEIKSFISLVEEHLPQLSKRREQWTNVTEKLNELFPRWSSTKKANQPRCDHQIEAQLGRMEKKYRTDCRLQTGGKDVEPWHSDYARMKEKEAGASGGLHSGKRGSRAVDKRVQQLRDAAEKQRKRKKLERDVHEKMMKDYLQANSGRPASGNSSSADVPIPRAVRVCTSCFEMYLLQGHIQLAASTLPHCVHTWEIKDMHVTVPQQQPARGAQQPVAVDSDSEIASSLARDLAADEAGSDQHDDPYI